MYFYGYNYLKDGTHLPKVKIENENNAIQWFVTHTKFPFWSRVIVEDEDGFCVLESRDHIVVFPETLVEIQKNGLM